MSKKKNISLLALLIFALSYIIASIVYFVFKICVLIWSVWGYKKTQYFKVTNKRLFSLFFDKGAYGEFLICRHLKKLPGECKWLFNIYLPKENGETTEIDVVLIHESGIYVFESKNYSGWIFGTETEKIWTQSLKPSKNSKAKKYHFLNPIFQNILHLKYLNKELYNFGQLPVFSVILFGNRCKLKKIKLTTQNHTIIKLNELKKFMKNSTKTKLIQPCTIELIYSKLYPYTQVSEKIKQKHIEDIKVNHSLDDFHTEYLK